MKCPKCGNEKTFVLNTFDLGNIVIRRRRCPKCQYTMKTVERYGFELDLLKAKGGNHDGASDE